MYYYYSYQLYLPPDFPAVFQIPPYCHPHHPPPHPPRRHCSYFLSCLIHPQSCYFLVHKNPYLLFYRLKKDNHAIKFRKQYTGIYTPY